jgi:RHS repeat-associated protein
VASGIGGLLAMRAPGAGPGAGDLDAVYTYDSNGNVGQLVAWATGYGGAQGDEWVPGRLLAHYEYDPYANLTGSTGDYADENPVRFSTKYWDNETGLGYWGYRYYSPSLGRWISRDPIGQRGGAALYTYGVNDPIGRYDRLGLIDEGVPPWPPGHERVDEREIEKQYLDKWTGRCARDLKRVCGKYKCCCLACSYETCLQKAWELCDAYVTRFRAWALGNNNQYRQCAELAQAIGEMHLSNDCFKVVPANRPDYSHSYAAVFHACNKGKTSDARFDPWRQWNIGGQPWAPYHPKCKEGEECMLWGPLPE